MAARPDRARARNRRDVALAAALTATVAAFFSIVEFGQQRNFQTHAYDLGIEAQAVSGYADLHAPVSLMKGVHNGFGPNFSVLGDHFSPIISLVAPAYRAFPHVSTLLVVQGLLFAASVPFVWLFTARRLGRVAAYAIAGAYALSWGLQTAIANDFHEIAFAVPLLAIAIDRLDAGKLRTALVAAGALLFVKEDFGLVVAMFGFVVGLRTKRWKLAGIIAVVGIAATVITTKVLIPAAGGRADYYWSYYASLGANPAAALWHVVSHPVATLHLATSPEGKIMLLRWFFLPLGLASLGSPLVLLAVPNLAELLLSTNPDNYRLSSHYAAVLMPVLTLAAVDTVGKIGSRGRRPARVLAPMYAAGVLGVAVWSCTLMPFGDLAQSWWWHRTPYDAAQQAAVDAVPARTTVEASDRLAPHLVDRDHVMLLDATPRNAPWVILDEDHHNFPLTVGEQLSRPGWLRAHGYRQVFSRLGVSVFYRAPPAAGAKQATGQEHRDSRP